MMRRTLDLVLHVVILVQTLGRASVLCKNGLFPRLRCWQLLTVESRAWQLGPAKLKQEALEVKGSLPWLPATAAMLPLHAVAHVIDWAMELAPWRATSATVHALIQVTPPTARFERWVEWSELVHEPEDRAAGRKQLWHVWTCGVFSTDALYPNGGFRFWCKGCGRVGDFEPVDNRLILRHRGELFESSPLVDPLPRAPVRFCAGSVNLGSGPVLLWLRSR